MYGQTEATARLAVLLPEHSGKEGSIGRAIPGVTLKLVDDDGRDVPAGAVGNLVARGANVMKGYLDAPEATAEVVRDGWLWTGDLARVDADGFFFVTGRTREMLKLGGQRVSPAELEAVIATHPQVREAAVTGERDETGAEHAVAWVVGDVEATELLKHCRSQLAAALVPKRVEHVAALPRTSTGKLARHLLKVK
ncbi:MAG: long-chain fatty acid--CoA ligase, partial [Myxococcaceae bacterium]|nr:long-chain fatty acid--CoA ligase [Myxococcaceae bacterium]